MKNIMYLLPFIILAFTLAACSLIAPGSADPLAGSSWQLYAISKHTPIQDSHTTLKFDDGELSGSAGCNQYFGVYQIDGERISFSDLVNTEMACMEPRGVMEQEVEFMAFLREVTRFELTDGRLMLFGADREALAFEPG